MEAFTSNREKTDKIMRNIAKEILITKYAK